MLDAAKNLIIEQIVLWLTNILIPLTNNYIVIYPTDFRWIQLVIHQTRT